MHRIMTIEIGVVLHNKYRCGFTYREVMKRNKLFRRNRAEEKGSGFGNVSWTVSRYTLYSRQYISNPNITLGSLMPEKLS